MKKPTSGADYIPNDLIVIAITNWNLAGGPISTKGEANQTRCGTVMLSIKPQERGIVKFAQGTN